MDCSLHFAKARLKSRFNFSSSAGGEENDLVNSRHFTLPCAPNGSNESGGAMAEFGPGGSHFFAQLTCSFHPSADYPVGPR